MLILIIFGLIVSTTLKTTATETNERTMTAQELVNNMGVGWNLGNSLDSKDYQQLSVHSLKQWKNNYQMQAIIDTSYWTYWYSGGTKPNNISSSTNSGGLVWTASQINDSDNSKVASLSIQFINNQLQNSGDSKTTFHFTKLNIELTNGTIIDLLPSTQDYYSQAFSSNVTQPLKITSDELKTYSTIDLKNAIITADVKVDEYAISTRSDSTALNHYQANSVNYYEKLWGNPIVTQEMIASIKNKGFRSIRIPVTWYDHLSKDGIIDAEWLKRVKDVVDYAYNNDMYVVLDMHHDSGTEKNSYINAYTPNIENNKKKVTQIWTQISAYFKDYDNHLIFEGMNEITNGENNWDWGTQWDDFRTVHDLEQAFIDTVRSTGGNNSDRFLMVGTFGNSTDSAPIEHLFYKTFSDSANDKLILSLHTYSTTELDSLMSSLSTYSYKYKIPIVITEFGCKTKDSNESSQKNIENIDASIVKAAKKNNITCFVWDDGSDYKLFDRQSNTWTYDSIASSIVKASQENILVNNISMTIDKSALNVSEKTNTHITVSPNNATDTSYNIQSSNSNVARVMSNGEIIAVGNGTATITATANDGGKQKASVTVTVKTLAADLHFQPISELFVGQTVAMHTTIVPDTTTNTSCIFSSSNTKIATVSSKGSITAVSPGKVEISVCTADGSKIRKSEFITIMPDHVDINCDPKSYTIKKGTTTTHVEAYLMEGDSIVSWTSSNPNIATATKYGATHVKIVANNYGTCTITVATKNYGIAKFNVTVATYTPGNILVKYQYNR